jgi:hypothetical protein
MLKRFGLTPVMRRDRALEWQSVTAEMITRSLPLVAVVVSSHGVFVKD